LEKIGDLVEEHGTKWSLIATFFPGRTDNFIMKQYLRWMKKRNPSSTSSPSGPSGPSSPSGPSGSSGSSKAPKRTVPTKKRGRPPKEKVSKEPIQPCTAKRPRGRPKKNP
jgi:hypothetical protein